MFTYSSPITPRTNVSSLDGGKSPDNAKQQEVTERKEEHPVMFPDNEGQLVMKEIPEPSFVTLVIAVNTLEYARGEAIDEMGHFTVAVKGFGVRQVV